VNKKGNYGNDKKPWEAVSVIFYISKRIKIMANIGGK
jgi:hypothetical protein